MKKIFRKGFIAVSLLIAQAHTLFAADGLIPSGMQSFADNIKSTMTSDFIKVIFACFLCGSAIAYAFNKDNEKIKRSAIAIGVGAAILMSATAIIDMVWSAS
ncbi:MAG: TrbC/VirB2 family protein [Spirochaetaceae bacterium]|jgi:glycerol uptake facilitator-like aquaporin|nr:TrbC/VirB2 family protein [Spirochaetaceae bacterium]